MSYRITYGEKNSCPPGGAAGTFGVQLTAGVILLVSVLLMKWFLPDAGGAITALFTPGPMPATLTMAQILSGGGTLRDGMIGFCRCILEASGYGG